MSLIISEYLCPEHGRFEITIERPAPDAISCPDCVMLVYVVLSHASIEGVEMAPLRIGCWSLEGNRYSYKPFRWVERKL